MTKIEIMSPAGNFESLQAAIQGGADSIYFGLGDLNMRSRGAKNFTIQDLPEIVSRCKKGNVKTYLALNIVLYNNDIDKMKKTIQAAKDAGVSAIIASDLAAIQFARSIEIPVHISTQQNVSNLEAVKFFAQFSDTIVLARELKLEQIEEICSEIKKQKIKGPSGELVKIEIFVHGALCVSISGKCYMSLACTNCSANRGECSQICRKKYRVLDDETGEELLVDNQYIMSPKDLCTIRFLDKILASGVSVLKIEGRARTPEYVKTVTNAYKSAVSAVNNKTYTKEKIAKWEKELSKVYNRGFWHGGYYLGKELGEWSGVKGSQATQKRHLIGKVEHYYDKKQIAHLSLTHEINKGDELIIIGPTTGVLNLQVSEVFKDGAPTKKPAKGQDITIPIKDKVRHNDQVFKLEDKN